MGPHRVRTAAAVVTTGLIALTLIGCAAFPGDRADLPGADPGGAPLVLTSFEEAEVSVVIPVVPGAVAESIERTSDPGPNIHRHEWSVMVIPRRACRNWDPATLLLAAGFEPRTNPISGLGYLSADAATMVRIDGQAIGSRSILYHVTAFHRIDSEALMPVAALPRTPWPADRAEHQAMMVSRPAQWP